MSIETRGTRRVVVVDSTPIGANVRVLLGVLDRLIKQGASVVVIEHDLDMVANVDWVIDMGPGGGHDGGRVVATGTSAQVADDPAAVTGRYLGRHLGRRGT
ncbi:hypothetical protein [Actinomyces wuliandei]|uniref:hypothetical protein n=2 Tax=Actinomyces wuliandei TaxID=2057743 RepID=UPI0019D43555|nr:hypothetical protein [Actinomyces wuliandei]